MSLVHADSIKPREISSGSLGHPVMASKSAYRNALPFNSFLVRLALVWPRDDLRMIATHTTLQHQACPYLPAQGLGSDSLITTGPSGSQGQ